MRLAVHIAAVANAVDTYDANLVSNLVNHAIVAYADAPVVLGSGQFTATRRAWVCRERPNGRDDAVVDVRGEA